MTQIPLLEPVVLNEVVRLLQTPENLVLSNSLPKTSTPVSFYTWDLLKGSRMVAKPNVPNAEAHIVPRLGRAQRAASLVYTREKKEFEPTTTLWLREIGTTNQIERAEEAVLREITDLNTRLDNFVEYACWQALQGTLSFNYADVVAPTIDYGIDNIVHPAVGWNTASPEQIVEDIQAWKRLAMRSSRVALTDAWCSGVTLDRVFNAFARNAATGGFLLTDAMKSQYYASGTLPNFMGLNWHVVEGQYDDDSAAAQQFLADDVLILTNLSFGEAMKIVEGPSADFGAPQGYIGKFSKTWEEEDPSGRQALLEYRFLPVITRPDQVVICRDVKTP